MQLPGCAVGFALHNIPAGSGFTPDVPSQNNSGVQASLETFKPAFTKAAEKPFNEAINAQTCNHG